MRPWVRLRSVTCAATLVAVAVAVIIAIACGNEASLKVAKLCPRQLERSDAAIVERSDGAIIAVGILIGSSDELLLDAQELADLTEEVDRILSLSKDDLFRKTTKQ